MKQQIFYEEFDSFYYYSGSSQNWEMKGYHFHKEYEVILFLNAGAVISIGKRTYPVEAGDVFLINNQEYHKTVGAGGQEYRRLVLMFDPEPVERAGEALGYTFTKYFNHHPAENHKLHLSGERLEEMISLFKRIEDSCHEMDEPAGQVVRKLRILDLLFFISRMYDFFAQGVAAGGEDGAGDGSGPESGENLVLGKERIEQIKRYIGEHVDEKLDLERLADHFYLSRHYLSHYFKKETGFTLGQYITSRKMDHAKDLLRKGFSVTETAVALSYHSDSHFINTFKRMTGTTPKKYAVEKQT